MLEVILKQLVGSVAKSTGENKNSGKKRHQHTAVFKAAVITCRPKSIFALDKNQNNNYQGASSSHHKLY